jgi:hypothetical protein
MIEHMFGYDKFGAEFPSAAQDPIPVNFLLNTIHQFPAQMAPGGPASRAEP